MAYEIKQTARTLIAWLIAPALAATGFRFSKHFRWGTTFAHRIVYRCVNTVVANLTADVISPRKIELEAL